MAETFHIRPPLATRIFNFPPLGLGFGNYFSGDGEDENEGRG